MLRLLVKRVALYSCKGTELLEKCFYLLVGKCYHFYFFPPHSPYHAITSYLSSSMTTLIPRTSIMALNMRMSWACSSMCVVMSASWIAPL